MSVVWRKVRRDLWHNKLRTLLVILATATGVFSLGLVFGLYSTMTVRLDESMEASVPPHIFFRTGLFNKSLIDAIESEPGVVVAEGEARGSFQWKLAGETDWRTGAFFARDDYEAQIMYPIELLEGDWPAKRTLAIERMSANYFDLPVGTTVLVKAGQREYSLPIEGLVRHPHTPPPQMGEGDATFGVTMETAAWLTGQEEGFNLLSVRMESFSFEAASELGERIDDRLEESGVVARQTEGAGEDNDGPHGDSSAGSASSWSIVDPDVHWGQQEVDTVALILVVLGLLSLGLSGFLIINTTNAAIVQQVWQIGVMKVVGATGGRVARVYLATALVYGLISLLVAVPLAAVGSHLMSIWLLDLFNIIFDDFRVMPEAVAIQMAAGLAVPLLAALVPVLGGVRITPHKAIGSHGLGGSFGRGWLDRLIGRVRHLPRPLALSLRNTFRRKARVALTLSALAIGGVIFIMVMSVSTSFSRTLDVLLDDFGFDLLITLDRPYSVARLLEASESVPGVNRAEVWNRLDAQLLLPNSEDLAVGVWGVTSDSEMFNPRIVSGRALLPQEGNAILLNNKIAADEGFKVGDEVELTVAGRESTWTVVGLIVNVNNGSRDNFVPFDALARASGGADRGEWVVVTFDTQDPKAQQRLTNELRDAYERQRIKTTYFETASQLRERNRKGFNVILYLLLAMVVLSVVVGSAGLMSTMSITVVERVREIGMMRAIGATSLGIVGIFVVEGVVIGVLSWLLAMPLSYPGARVFCSTVGMQLVDWPLDFSYPVQSLGFWLTIVVGVSALASLWPALRATRVSVRESLAYE